MARTINYTRLTFLLSVIGFLGSIGFYVSVLSNMPEPVNPIVSRANDSISQIETEVVESAYSFEQKQVELEVKSQKAVDELVTQQLKRDESEKLILIQLGKDWDSLPPTTQKHYIDNALNSIQ